jgi:hypothetical protein
MGQVTLADDPEARVDMAPVIDVTSSPDIPLTPGDLVMVGQILPGLFGHP